MKLLRALLAGLLLLSFTALSAGAETRVIPDLLRFSQEQDQKQIGSNRLSCIVYPHTANETVNAEMRALVDAMYEQARPSLPARGKTADPMSRIDVGPYISRVGDRWMSFLTVARVTDGHSQLYVDFDARVYQMDDGHLVTLPDLLADSADGWSFLAERVHSRLSEHFPDLTADEAALNGLCAPEALRETAITLSPGHLTMHYAAEPLYPGKVCLLRVEIPWSELKPYMTETALHEIDCTGYALAALTYDDGPAGGPSNTLMNELRLHGAAATFFTLGFRIRQHPEILHREYDANFSVQSHGMYHKYKATSRQVSEWTQEMAQTMAEVIGVPPVLFRSPGGNDAVYIAGDVGLPLIHWSCVSDDSDGTPEGSEKIRRVGARVSYAGDGDIILMHDLKSNAFAYARIYLPALERRNFLTVTVEDLCELRGYTLTPNGVLSGCPPKEGAEN